MHFNRCLCFESARLFSTPRTRGRTHVRISNQGKSKGDTSIFLLYAYAISLDVLMMYMMRNPTLVKQSSVLSDLFFCNTVTKKKTPEFLIIIFLLQSCYLVASSLWIYGICKEVFAVNGSLVDRVDDWRKFTGFQFLHCFPLKELPRSVSD